MVYFFNPLKNCVDIFGPKVKILYYTDLVSNPQKYIDSIFDFIGLEPIPVTNKEKPLSITKPVMFSPNKITQINTEIDQLSTLLGKDFSDWKRNS